MTHKIEGGCKCGAVTYAGEIADMPPFRCYCRDCQQITGSGHAEMMPLLAATLVVNGETRTFEMAGRSGRKTVSRFCPNCGSPLFRQSERSPQRIYAHAGSLVQPELYHVALEIYEDAAQPWDGPAKPKE